MGDPNPEDDFKNIFRQFNKQMEQQMEQQQQYRQIEGEADFLELRLFLEELSIKQLAMLQRLLTGMSLPPPGGQTMAVELLGMVRVLRWSKIGKRIPGS